jgi:hypothetical protein
MTDITLEIMPSGHIKFKRGDKEYNSKVRQVISNLVDGDEDVMAEIDEFLSGSEDSELLIGDRIFCG